MASTFRNRFLPIGEVRVASVSEDEVLLLWRALMAYRSGSRRLPGDGKATAEPLPAARPVPALARAG